MAELWAAKDHRRTEASRLGNKPQTGASHHAGRQSALCAEEEGHRDDQFQSRAKSVPEPGAEDGVDRRGPALGSRYNLHLSEEFVFLAVILDAYSRRVIGWALDRTLEDTLTLTTLEMALSRRVVQPGLVHHSDRGTQYASGDYTDSLKRNGIDISMSRKGNPWDNAACESFMKTLKYEEVFRNEYRNLREARASISEFFCGQRPLPSAR